MKDNQLLLPNGKLITFNNEQTDALNKIKHWLMNGDLFFTLSGYAGTGKTYMLKAAKEIWEQSGYNLIGLATSGKAASGCPCSQQPTGHRSRSTSLAKR